MSSPIHPVWSTSSLGHGTDTTLVDLAALSQHLGLCQRHQGRLFALKCHGEIVGQFVASRVVTTLMVGVTVMSACAALLL